MTIAIEQDAQAPGRATVTASGSGIPCLDDRPVPARVVGGSVELSLRADAEDGEARCVTGTVGLPPPLAGYIRYSALVSGTCRFDRETRELGGIHLLAEQQP